MTALTLDAPASRPPRVRFVTIWFIGLKCSQNGLLPPLAVSNTKCWKCKTRSKARRKLFSPTTPQPIAFISPPLTSKGGTAAQNHNAVESYEATAVHNTAGASPSANHSAECQSPSTIYGGAATPAGCNSPYLATMASGPSSSNLCTE